MSETNGAGSEDPTRPEGVPRFEPPPAGPVGGGWAPSTPGGPAAPGSTGSASTATPPPDRPASPAAARFDDHDRPAPALPGLLGAAGGALTLISLFGYLDQIDADRQRSLGLLLCFVFEVVGLVGLVVLRGRRAASWGVTVSALVVLPLLFLLFIDPGKPDAGLGSVGDVKGKVTGILVVAALLWLLAYAVGPGRRHGLYLAAALVAIWATFIVQLALSGLDGYLQQATAFEPDFGPSGGSSSFQDFPSPPNPATKIGVASLLIGLAYLALAATADRRGDHRMGTPAYGVAVPILVIGIVTLGDPLHVPGASVLGLLVALAVIVLGVAGGRRFTSWSGAVGVVVAITAFFADLVHNQGAFASVLLFVGILLAVVAAVLSGPADPAGPAGPGTPAVPAAGAGPSSAGETAATTTWGPAGAAGAWGPPAAAGSTTPPTAPSAPPPWAPPPGEVPKDDPWAPPPT